MHIVDWLFARKKEQNLSATKAEVLPKQPLDGIDDEQYVKDCLRKKYEELPETRSWNSDPAFQKVLDPLNSEYNDVAWMTPRGRCSKLSLYKFR